MKNGLLWKYMEANCIQTYIQYLYRCALLKPSEPKHSVQCINTLSNVQDICIGVSFDNCANEGGDSTTGTHHSSLSDR